MRISPVTNPQILYKPVFAQKGKPSLSKADAQILLNNYESITREHFKDGLIHIGIAKLDFSLKNNINNLKDLYKHTLIDLGMKAEELRTDIAIKEALKQDNYRLLKLLLIDMEMLPITPQKKVDENLIFKGLYDKQIEGVHELFKFARKRAGYMDSFFKYEPPVKDNSAKIVLINQIKDMINNDEESDGIVSLDTIYEIVSNPDFTKIKDERLNISGSKILHILAESSFDSEKEEDVQLVKNILQKCSYADYDFDIKDDFGETAFTKAKESGNSLLADLINKRRIK